jgi:POT family proton-dependent oligopeptide transporter
LNQTADTPGDKVSVWNSFPSSFWIANVMEIFERMGWYGFYAVSSLYLTGPVADGGLGFSSDDRGVIQGLATFFLYLFPAVFGALADRYGYRRMFIAATSVMVPGYLLLSLPETFWAFLGVYFLVAVGHGMFKPVVISTVTKATTEKTGSMGFGIFYMMVNIGGFFGPIVAGFVRGWDWNYVFYASAGWSLMVGIVALIFYKEPPRDDATESSRSLSDVFAGMIEVVGNGRFFLLVVGVLTTLVMGSKWLEFSLVLPATGVWIAFNFLWDFLTRLGGDPTGKPWFMQPMRVGEGRYLTFLLLMSGFWTSFNQIFMTLPEYIRDYTSTADLIRSLGPLAGSVASLGTKMGFDTSSWAKLYLDHGEVKPEHLINLNAAGIIFGQVGISYLSRKLPALTTMILGTLITVVSLAMFYYGQAGWVIVIAVLIFSVGEMLASPKSKEYAGRIAPPEKVGMYMGYFYWSVALGNLFGGLLSGESYQYFGPEGIDQPGTMWLMFAGLALVSAIMLGIYDRWVKRNPAN